MRKSKQNIPALLAAVDVVDMGLMMASSLSDANFNRLRSSFKRSTWSLFLRCSSTFWRYSFISGETSSAALAVPDVETVFDAVGEVALAMGDEAALADEVAGEQETDADEDAGEGVASAR